MEVYTLQFIERPSTYYVFDKENWDRLQNGSDNAIPFLMFQKEVCTCEPCNIARAKAFHELLAERDLTEVMSIYSTAKNFPYPFGTKKDNTNE